MCVSNDNKEGRCDAEHEQNFAACQSPLLRTVMINDQAHLDHHYHHDEEHLDHDHYDLHDSHLVLYGIEKYVREGWGIRYAVMCQCQAVVGYHCRDGGVL